MAPNTKIFCGGKNQLPSGTKTQCSSQRRIPFFNLTAHQSSQPNQLLTTSLEPGILHLWNLYRSINCAQRNLFQSEEWNEGQFMDSDNQMADTKRSRVQWHHYKTKELSFSIINTLSELAASIFSPFASYLACPNENKNISFDLIAFHFSLQGSKN